MDDIESWLDITEKDVAEAAAGQPAGDTLSSSEFDQFLADRAAAGGMRSGSVKGGSNRPRQRQMQMENQADDEMFGLWFNCENTFFFQTITLVLKHSSAVKELYKRIMDVCFVTRILVIDIFVKELL